MTGRLEGKTALVTAAGAGIGRAAAEMLVYRARRGFRTAYEGLGEAAAPAGCARLAPLLSRMLDDEVSTPTWHALSAHLEACDHCRRELKALKKTRELPALLPA